MNEHLNRWLPQFTADLKTAAALDAYMLLGSLLERSLANFI
jgi:TorA maturation chaperone TorD